MKKSLKGRLTIVGSGIKLAAHLTLEAKAYIEQSEKCLYLVNDPAMEQWLLTLNPQAESLQNLYAGPQPRSHIYQTIAEKILSSVRHGEDVCVVFYGHPSVFVSPTRIALQQAKQEGYVAKILPGISAEDCLFSDLCIDPGQYGCQSYEATDFLLYKRQYDAHSHLILWQIGEIGNIYLSEDKIRTQANLQLLVNELFNQYNPSHQVVVYEAALYAGFEPLMHWLALKDLPDYQPSHIATLYVTPLAQNPIDIAMVNQLGITNSSTKN
jgi:uncharacterized protein YabN with tetrapyrrole methylase and pyrophosphatase domain